MSASGGIECVRCGRSAAPRVNSPTFPGDLGERIAAEICAACWDDWKSHQMALINHYALNLRDARARSFLTRSMEAFLFGGDDEAGTGADAPPTSGPPPGSGPAGGGN